jgi:hypothetical protein
MSVLMRRLTSSELRFLIWFAVTRLPKALLRDMQSDKDQAKRERAVDIATDQICDRLDRHEVHAPDPLKQHG